MVKDMQQYVFRVKEWYQDERLKKCKNLAKKYERIAPMDDEKADKIGHKISKLREEIFSDVHPKFKHIYTGWESFHDYTDGVITLHEFIQDTIRILNDINDNNVNRDVMFSEVLDEFEIDDAKTNLEIAISHDLSAESEIERLRELKVSESEILSIINQYKSRFV